MSLPSSSFGIFYISRVKREAREILKFQKNGRGLFIRKFYDTKNFVITLITPCKLSLITPNKLLIKP